MKQCDKCNRKFPDHMVFCPFDGDILDSEVEDPLLGSIHDALHVAARPVGEDFEQVATDDVVAGTHRRPQIRVAGRDDLEAADLTARPQPGMDALGVAVSLVGYFWLQGALIESVRRMALRTAPLIALGCNSASYRQDGEERDATADYHALGTEPGYCHHMHTGRCPVGIATQDPGLEARLDPQVGAERVANYLRAVTLELTTLARACGKSDVHNLEPEDLVALTVEAAAMAKVPLAGTDWIPGRSEQTDG